MVAARDTPLVLAKGGRREEALLRQAIFLTTSLAVVKATETAPETYRWADKGFLQRQLCVTSISGLFACSAADTETLADAQSGQAPMPEPPGHPLADTAIQTLDGALKARADELFATDRDRHFDPILKAAGVRVLIAAPPPPDGRRARRGRAAAGGSSG